MELFDSNTKWYKGNLHTHSTRSDGKLSAEECAARYKKEGYAFLAITDHRVYGETYQTDDFLILAGEEFMHEDYNRDTAYHIIGIGQDSHFVTDNNTPPQEVIDNIRRRGGWVIMGHPTWSLMSAKEIADLKGIDAIEGYSGISDAYSSRGDSMNIMDVLATQGKFYGVVAVDDMHFNARDFARGFVCVQAEKLAAEDIMKGLREGKYYSSQGPEIYSLSFDGETLRAEFSPVKRVSFMTNTWYVKDRVRLADGDEYLTCAEYKIKPRDKWVRFEATDENGLTCWSNYVKVRE